MRAFLNVANEGFQGDGRILSLEEEQDNLVEAAQDAAQVDADLQQVDRMTDVSDSLEDLAMVADGIEARGDDEGATETEQQMGEILSNVAVAGTDVAGEDVVPAMESFGGRRLRYSAESIRERAKAIWESILKFLKQIWEKITNFFYKIFGTIPGIRRRLVELKKRVDDNTRKVVSNKKITISSGVASLSCNYKTPTNEGELKKNFTALVKGAKELYGEGMEVGHKLGEIVLKGLEDFDGEKPSASLGKFVRDMKPISARLNKAAGGGMTRVSGDRFGKEIDAEISEPLLGNMSIVVKTPKADDREYESPRVMLLEKLRHIGIEMVTTSEKPKDVPASFEMSPATNSGMAAMLDDALEGLDVLEKFQRGKRFNEMKTLRGKLETASNKLATEMDKLAGSDDKAEREAVPYFRAMVNFNSAYARWMKEPALPMVNHLLASIRGVSKVVEKSLAAYE
jgi:hypothetical protein